MKPNTCPQCGCYIPDGWGICPACERRVPERQQATEANQRTTWGGGGGSGIVSRNPYVVNGGGSTAAYTSVNGKIIWFKWENTDG